MSRGTDESNGGGFSAWYLPCWDTGSAATMVNCPFIYRHVRRFLDVIVPLSTSPQVPVLCCPIMFLVWNLVISWFPCFARHWGHCGIIESYSKSHCSGAENGYLQRLQPILEEYVLFLSCTKAIGLWNPFSFRKRPILRPLFVQ